MFIYFHVLYSFPTDHLASWTSQFQGRNAMYRCNPLQRWKAIIPQNMRDAERFIQSILQVSKPMGFNVAQPEM